MMKPLIRGLWVGIACWVLAGCGAETTPGSGSGDSAGGELVIGVEKGAVFGDGTLVEKFNQADLFVTPNGDKGPRAATGGTTSTKNEPANWFYKGGLATVFSSLDEVPNTKPEPGAHGVILNVEAGYGFVIKNYASGGYTRGWVKSATPSQITVEYEVFE